MIKKTVWRFFVLILVLIGTAALIHAEGKQGENPSTPTAVKFEKATFAGGCFWCMESDFEKVDGVVSVVSGYTGGQKENPTYKEVSAGGTGHAEVVQVTYDPAKITYARLLSVYWKNIDPTVSDRQFCDIGDQYRTTLFYHNEEQRHLAETSKKILNTTKPFKEPIVTPIVPASTFYEAEGYHQDYHKKNPIRYKFYRTGCGRDDRLEALWGTQ
jgi:peptide-methionine (S)-S-oxide reductase